MLLQTTVFAIFLQILSPLANSNKLEPDLQYSQANFEEEIFARYHDLPHYSKIYDWLAKLANRRDKVDLNAIVDAVLEIIRNDLHALRFPFHRLVLTVPEAVIGAEITFGDIGISGAETIARSGDCTLEQLTNGELVFDFPLMFCNSSADGYAGIEIMGLRVYAPLAGVLTNTTGELGVTIFPQLGYPQVTKLMFTTSLGLPVHGLNPVLAWLLAIIIIWISLFGVIVMISIIACFLLFRIWSLSRKVKAKGDRKILTLDD